MKKINTRVAILIIFALLVVGIGMAIKKSVSPEEMYMPVATGAEDQARYEWSFQNMGTEEDTGASITAVTLRADGVTHEIGTYQGDCFVIEGSDWEYQEHEVSGAICWFAGGGSEIGVFNENGSRVVKVGDLDEGSAETAGVRGNFRTVVEL